MNRFGLKQLLFFTSVTILASCQTAPQQHKTEQEESKPTAAVLRYHTVHHPVIARHGMVASQNRLASQVGQQVLQNGGNAIDAAVAMGFALAVTLPRAGNIGGSGFLLAHIADANEAVALDFRSAAPAKARTEDFMDEDGEIDAFEMTFSVKAPGVPGTVAGLHTAWQRWGSLPWPDLVAPAIKLAEEGFTVNEDLAFALAEFTPIMQQFDASKVAYSKADGSVYLAGDLLRQPDLAWSLKQIAEHGADAMYRGSIAERIVSHMQQQGGYITKEDLANYTVKDRQPIATNFNGYRVVTMPPVSGGGIALLQMLNVMEKLPLREHAAGSANSLHLIAETMKRAAANRRIGIGDPDFVSVPVKQMLSPSTTNKIVAKIDPLKARAVSQIQPMRFAPYPSNDTTHYSVADRHGNAVSLTYTLGYSFGSGMVIPGTGILMDNQLRNFSHRDAQHANGLAPGKRMVSTMSPTIVYTAAGKPYMVTGSPGGGRIPNIVAQLLVNVLLYDKNLAVATHAPRIHQQWRTAELGYERGLSIDTVNRLAAMGHVVKPQQTMGSTQSILMHDGYFFGAADPRRPNAAALGVE